MVEFILDLDRSRSLGGSCSVRLFAPSDMRLTRQPASVSTWVVRLTTVGIAVLGADWALGQRESTALLPIVYPASPADDASAPRTLELISATVVEPAADMERRHSEAIEPLTTPTRSSGIRFAEHTASMVGDASAVLDRVANLLSRHEEATTVVRVTGREFDDPARDRMLKRERGRAVIAALVSRGMPFSRISIETDSEENSGQSEAHRVSLDIDTHTRP